VTSPQSLAGADGILLLNPTTLLVVAGSQSTVFRVVSSDAGANTITRCNTNEDFVLYPYTATALRFAITKGRF
jgi:hypothetical protein